MVDLEQHYKENSGSEGDVFLKNTTIPWAKPTLWGGEAESVLDALQSTWISGGPYLQQLEEDFEKYCSVPDALAVMNGTAAIYLALIAFNIKPGDEILCPGFAFQAVANVATHLGATPVFADVLPDTWLIDPADVLRKISAKTRCIAGIHTYGNVCDMDTLHAIAEERGIFLLEDAAQGFPSRRAGRVAGSIGDIGTLSLHATKAITTGEGGMLLTSRESFVKRAELYRSHGMLRKVPYWHDVPGLNFRMTNIQAALGCAQFKHLETIIDARRALYDLYASVLGSVEGLALQAINPEVSFVPWTLGIRLTPSAFPERDNLMLMLKEIGVETRPGFYPPSRLPYFSADSLPISEHLGEHVICLPLYPGLSASDVEKICEGVLQWRL